MGTYRWALVGLGTLAVALLILSASEVALLPNFGLSIDEVHSLWASDHAVSLWGSFERVTSDTNPPLYYELLWLARWVADEPFIAFMLVNGAALVVASAFVIFISWRAEALTFGLLGVAALIVSGSTFFFFMEGRGFFVGECISYAAAWQCALMVVKPETPRRLGWLVAFGVIGSLIHFYSGLFVGCMAGGVVAAGVLLGRRDLIAPGMVMGIAAALTTLAWSLYAADRVDGISWLTFSFHVVREAFQSVRALMMGPSLMLIPLAAILAFSAVQREARPLLLTFGIAGLAFFAIPVVISFKVPVIMARYWSIGAPAVTALLMFLAWMWLQQRSRFSNPMALSIAAFFALAAVLSFPEAKRFMVVQPAWRGAAAVTEMAQGCAAGSIHVTGYPNLYAVASLLPESTFLPVERAATLDTNEGSCPVLGWAEHVMVAPGYPLTAPESELLGLVGVEAAPGDVRLLRYQTGFVVLRADAPHT